ncbi:membrane spanning 4-domains A3 [Homo sapiens]|uniref:Isoform 2 of Membrane-spanning 4-domains subfamily A member 3 n=1 Tax=Homo sapiens TaxID=9606 RepID=Q96HJ5-2|nr:membrane-spanning 4-domains subfamily A member 3 isoform b [Homo sapiens]AAM23312.1 membrane-spanning 4-domains,subfamily A, member3 isoform [Homo sapiens]EAW73863.1 membrane-spanning 4-domains, subfamily A, member 3 (hematopoietic cell-specific), isoform CRA_a [Homo sapiens]KAI2560156.1 membrane spanning 4-domains A3 [Homo sapiens]KAI2560157.1 membrane spanning 4-domains A3 [Homo sapiens]KAI4071492.1 membrane spanning 4-domains A3 [Homo sapiens]|eukprot:NP_001026979.1 membrane-spanning 4-domains subfamily A member 3 isoform b [Homo sapiens]
MASHEVDNAELGSASAHGTPGSEAGPEELNTSVYQPIDGSPDYQKAKLQVLGFCSSGTLSVVAGIKPTRTWIQNSFGMNIASATIALVGTAFLSLNIAVNIQSLRSCHSSSESPDLCNYMGSISNGMVSLLLILTLLELCVTISTIAMWCNANCCNSREEISSPPNSV